MSALALVVLACWATDAPALEFKNVRPIYGPFGVSRPTNSKVMLGDVYHLSFDIVGLTVDPKSGGAQYTITWDVFDPKGKQIIPEKERVFEKGVVVGLGGDTVPDLLVVLLGVDQPVGKYKVVVTVEDKKSKAKAKLEQEVEVQKTEFGLIHVQAPAMGLVGQDYVAEFTLVGWGRDKKKMPKITVTTQVLDSAGKPTVANPGISDIPKDMPAVDWPNTEIVRMRMPVFLNRPGRYTIQIEARDELNNKTTKFSYPLNVIDAGGK
jgi:hypothetical protein